MEIWLPITNYESYEISNHGRVRNTKTNKILKTFFNHKGYHYIKLYHSNGTRKNFSIHRLVGLMFIPNPENKPQINHKNGIKTDNHVDNLEWNTGEENIEHAMNSDFMTLQKRKLTKDDVYVILENKDDLSKKQLSTRFNVSESTISDIRNGKSYKLFIKNYTGVINKFKSNHNYDSIRKLSYDNYVYIIENLHNTSHHELAKQFNISRRTLYSIKNNRTYKEYYEKYNKNKFPL